jgi:hypothetical protein
MLVASTAIPAASSSRTPAMTASQTCKDRPPEGSISSRLGFAVAACATELPTYRHIRIKLAATSSEPTFLATSIGPSGWSRQFRFANELKIESGMKRLFDA